MPRKFKKKVHKILENKLMLVVSEQGEIWGIVPYIVHGFDSHQKPFLQSLYRVLSI